MLLGELAALASAITFSFTAVVDKSLTRRLRPLPMAALSSLGGTLFALGLLFALGKAGELPNAPVDALVLSAAGGLISIGIGMPLYLTFLKSVDVSKASPISNGLFSLMSVLAGLVLLGEYLSALTASGIAVIIAGIYMLSFSQRRQYGAAQAKWLGPRGIVFLMGVVALWVAGTSLQRVALRDLDVFIANAVRLAVVALALSAIAASEAAIAPGRPRPRFPTARRRRAGLDGDKHKVPEATAGRREAAFGRFSQPRSFPYGKDNGETGLGASRQFRVRIKPPVDWSRLGDLEAELAEIKASLSQRERGRARGGLLFDLDLPWQYSPEEALAAMPSVASVRRAGGWPGTQRLELALREQARELTTSRPAPPAISPAVPPRIREVNPESFSPWPLVVTIVNGGFSYGLGSLLMLVALQKAGLAIAVVLNSTQLLWVALLSAVLLRERLTLKTMGGIAITALGVAMVVV